MIQVERGNRVLESNLRQSRVSGLWSRGQGICFSWRDLVVSNLSSRWGHMFAVRTVRDRTETPIPRSSEIGTISLPMIFMFSFLFYAGGGGG